MKNRRAFLLGGSLLAVGAFGATLYHKTLRFPRMGFEPVALPQAFDNGKNRFEFQDFIVLEDESGSGEAVKLRAIAPEPKLDVNVQRGQLTIKLNNISPIAKLAILGQGVRNIEETIDGIDRTITIDAATDQSLQLAWSMPESSRYTFAVIGDTGGNTELDWCLQRAAELGAQFLLHLGDFNYGKGDYQRAIEQFHSSPLPCYISIGNHDFNDSGLVYQHFRSNLGPFNNAFTFAGTRFVNFDTAADFLPASGGMRGEMFEQLVKEPSSNQVFFTHRPLRDPRPGHDHVVSGMNEDRWIQQMIAQSGGGTLLTGHVHHSAELNVNGIKQYTVGEGLGHEDILLQQPTAQLLLGHIEHRQPPTFEWADINMPWEYRRSHTHLQKLKKRGDARLIDWYNTHIGEPYSKTRPSRQRAATSGNLKL